MVKAWVMDKVAQTMSLIKSNTKSSLKVLRTTSPKRKRKRTKISKMTMTTRTITST